MPNLSPEQIKSLEKLQTLINKRALLSKLIVKKQAELDKIEAELSATFKV